MKPINNVFVMGAMGNILVVKSDGSYVSIKEIEKYRVLESSLENKEKVFLIEWDFDPQDPLTCMKI